MKAAIRSLRARNAKEIIVAVPVGEKSKVKEISKLVNRVEAVTTPKDLRAVGRFYLDFGQTTDEEVIHLMQQSEHWKTE